MTDRSDPIVETLCSHSDCEGKSTYRLVGNCANCKSESIIGVFTMGHEAKSGWGSPPCPVCGCAELYWKGLAGD